jgi:hypothetical protein
MLLSKNHSTVATSFSPYALIQIFLTMTMIQYSIHFILLMKRHMFLLNYCFLRSFARILLNISITILSLLNKTNELSPFKRY